MSGDRELDLQLPVRSIRSIPIVASITFAPRIPLMIVIVILIGLITIHSRKSSPRRTPVAAPTQKTAEERPSTSRSVPAHAAVMAKVSQHSREEAEFVVSVRIGSCRLHLVFLHSTAWTKTSGQRLQASGCCNLARIFFVYASERMESKTELSISRIGQAVVTTVIEKARG